MDSSFHQRNLAVVLARDAKLPYLSRLLPKPGEVRQRPSLDPLLSVFGPPTKVALGGSDMHNFEPLYPLPNYYNAKRPVLSPFYTDPFRMGERDLLRRPEPVVPVLQRPCAQCRSAKVKCNREARCSRCVKLGIVCKMPPSPQQRRPRTASGGTAASAPDEDGEEELEKDEDERNQHETQQPGKRPRHELPDSDLFKPLQVDLNFVLSPSPETDLSQDDSPFI